MSYEEKRVKVATYGTLPAKSPSWSTSPAPKAPASSTSSPPSP
jgi:hypothetical protein